MKITGKLIFKGEVQQISEKFRKRDFAIEDNDALYPQKLIFQLVGDKCELMNMFNIGDELDIEFNLKGREWVSPQGETKFFNTLEAWKILKVVGSQSNELIANNEGDNGDLPF
jgi:hypothetical protein